MPALETTVELSNATLSAKVWGPKDGKKILALHGWLDNAGSFDYLAPLLPEYRIMALDLPGHGNSSHRPAGCMYHFVDAVGVVIQVLNQLGWSQAILLGHSMGAGVATLLAGTFPDRIEKLVLLEGLGPLSFPPEETPTRLAKSLMQQQELPTKRVPVYPDPEMAIKVRVKVSGFSENAAKPIVERGLKKIPEGWTWKTDPRLTIESPIRMTEEQVCSFLDRIEAPTLVIRATEGMSEKVLAWTSRLRHLRKLKLIELTGNHHFHLEEPVPVATVIQDFINSDA